MENKFVSPLNKDEQIKLLQDYLDCGGLEKNGQIVAFPKNEIHEIYT